MKPGWKKRPDERRYFEELRAMQRARSTQMKELRAQAAALQHGVFEIEVWRLYEPGAERIVRRIA